jgi:hypothetical protein
MCCEFVKTQTSMKTINYEVKAKETRKRHKIVGNKFVGYNFWKVNEIEIIGNHRRREK